MFGASFFGSTEFGGVYSVSSAPINVTFTESQLQGETLVFKIITNLSDTLSQAETQALKISTNLSDTLIETENLTNTLKVSFEIDQQGVSETQSSINRLNILEDTISSENTSFRTILGLRENLLSQETLSFIDFINFDESSSQTEVITFSSISYSFLASSHIETGSVISRIGLGEEDYSILDYDTTVSRIGIGDGSTSSIDYGKSSSSRIEVGKQY